MKTPSKEKQSHKKNSMIIPLILVFIFMTVMVIYVSSLMYRVAVSNTNAVMEDRILSVSAMINNHLNTAENVLHVAGDSVNHMLLFAVSRMFYENTSDYSLSLQGQMNQQE